MAHFNIKDLTFYYPTEDRCALKDINISIDRGEYITICGRSGSGKTTLLRHLKSVLAPHGKLIGSIEFNDRPLDESDLREQSSKIGYVMQNPDSQIVTDKVWHELAFGLESLGFDQRTIRLRVAEMASYFGIQDWFHRSVSELSGGQKQLLSLASIMAMQPEVLILDEPTAQLDPIAASDFLNTVRKINLELGTTIIITEHRLEDVFHASDRVIVMEDGAVIADDSPYNIGAKLKSSQSEMFAAMPAPVKIYYGIDDAAESDGCPLTVREGRNWLSGLFENYLQKDRSSQKESGLNLSSSIRGVSFQEDLSQEALDLDPDTAAVVMDEVWYRYERNSSDVLRGVSLIVPRGSIYAIVGGNGTGKSTTLRSICNICKPYRGKIYVDGKLTAKYRGRELFENNLAMLPQDPISLFVTKSVREDLKEMVSSDGNRIDEVASLCDIANLLDKHPYDLSGGEQQRAALAKVLLTNPRILLLDEPTKGIDNFFKEKFAEILAKLVAGGVTIIMVSHDVEFCAKYSDYVSMFFDGGIVTTNTPRRFFSNNSFYTTAANRMSRHIFSDAITDEDVIRLCQENLS